MQLEHVRVGGTVQCNTNLFEYLLYRMLEYGMHKVIVAGLQNLNKDIVWLLFRDGTMLAYMKDFCRTCEGPVQRML